MCKPLLVLVLFAVSLGVKADEKPLKAIVDTPLMENCLSPAYKGSIGNKEGAQCAEYLMNEILALYPYGKTCRTDEYYHQRQFKVECEQAKDRWEKVLVSIKPVFQRNGVAPPFDLSSPFTE